jgi:uncharacterized membrane protein YtjA (UPF0391 family)
MSLLRSIFREVLGLFVDDGNLALHVVLVIALIAGAVRFAGVDALAGGCLLLVGCIVILALSLWRKLRH